MIFTEINSCLLVVKQTLNKSTKLNKWRNDFLTEIFMLYMVIPNRINFKLMGRYSGYGEQRFRNQFKQKFDFMEFNRELTATYFGKRIAFTFDPSHIDKSGNKTAYLGNFCSGSDQALKKGLDTSEIAVIDLDLHQAFHLEAVQTVPTKTLKVVSMR